MIIDINEKIDWVAFFEQYVPLKKSGKDDFVGLCPFHDDRNQVSMSDLLTVCGTALVAMKEATLQHSL